MDVSHLVADNSIADFYVLQDTEIEQFAQQKPVFDDGKLVSGFLRMTPTNAQRFAAGILAKPLNQ